MGALSNRAIGLREQDETMDLEANSASSLFLDLLERFRLGHKRRLTIVCEHVRRDFLENMADSQVTQGPS